MLCKAATVLVLACLTPVVLASESPAARVVGVVGRVMAAEAGTSRVLENRDSVYVGNVIKTERKSRVTLSFTDGSELMLGPSSEASITTYTYGGAAGKMGLHLARGVFRFVTGLIGKINHDEFELRVPVATIGIRGTHFGAEVGKESATLVLLDQTGGGANAIEVSNAYGTVLLDQPGYGTQIPDAHSPPSPPKRLRLKTVETLTRNVFRSPAFH